jgi:hypothetical protein
VTYEDLLARIIADGIADVRAAYADPKDHHKRDGAIEGFEACRGKTPPELLELWAAAERQGQQIFRNRSGTEVASDLSAKDYWRQRYKSLQIEWVCNVVSVGLAQAGLPPLLAHLPTARAAMKYAEVVGVQDHGDVS